MHDEALKQVDKLTGAKLLVKYPEIDWKKAKGMKDIVAHHYFDVDAEAVLWFARNTFRKWQEQ